MNSYDAIIIGSGHNGLVAACYLAQSGKRVLVLEKNLTLGGATASVKTFSGVDAKLSRKTRDITSNDKTNRTRGTTKNVINY